MGILLNRLLIMLNDSNLDSIEYHIAYTLRECGRFLGQFMVLTSYSTDIDWDSCRQETL